MTLSGHDLTDNSPSEASPQGFTPRHSTVQHSVDGPLSFFREVGAKPIPLKSRTRQGTAALCSRFGIRGTTHRALPDYPCVVSRLKLATHWFF